MKQAPGAHVVTRGRIGWIDSVKGIAIVLVVLIHCMYWSYLNDIAAYGQVDTFSQVFEWVVYAAGRLGVPLFVMVAGYLMLHRDYESPGKIKEFWKKHPLNLLITTEIWIVVSEVFLYFYQGVPITVQDTVLQMLFLEPSGQGHLWYLPMILGIYLFLPLVSIALHHVDDRLLVIPVVVSFIWIACAFDMSPLTPAFQSGLDVSWSGGIYGLYLVMGYLVKRGHFDRIPKAVLWLVFLAAMAACIGIEYAYAHLGVDKNLRYDYATVFIASVALFCLLSRSKVADRSSKLMVSLSNATFGIYILHHFIDLPLCNYFAFIDPMPLRSLVVFAIVLPVSWGVVVLVKKLLPRFAKVVLYAR